MKYDAKWWSAEFADWDKRSRRWHREAGRTVNVYRAEKPSSRSLDNIFQLNLFHNHAQTLQEILSQTPPDVKVSRRFADADDDAGRVAATVLGRMLNTDIDDDNGQFLDTVSSCLQDWLIPGLGQGRVRYEVTEDPMAEMLGQDLPPLSKEAPTDYVHWRDFAFGYARQWSDTPWVAFASRVNKVDEIGRASCRERV